MTVRPAKQIIRLRIIDVMRVGVWRCDRENPRYHCSPRITTGAVCGRDLGAKANEDVHGRDRE
jgi:hypothetical protein